MDSAGKRGWGGEVGFGGLEFTEGLTATLLLCSNWNSMAMLFEITDT